MLEGLRRQGKCGQSHRNGRTDTRDAAQPPHHLILCSLLRDVMAKACNLLIQVINDPDQYLMNRCGGLRIGPVRISDSAHELRITRRAFGYDAPKFRQIYLSE